LKYAKECAISITPLDKEQLLKLRFDFIYNNETFDIDKNILFSSIHKKRDKKANFKIGGEQKFELRVYVSDWKSTKSETTAN